MTSIRTWVSRGALTARAVFVVVTILTTLRASGAEADLASARAQLARARDGRRPEDRVALTADAEAAAEHEALSKSTLDRTKILLDKGAATEDEYDRAWRGLRVDRAAHQAGRAR